MNQSKPAKLSQIKAWSVFWFFFPVVSTVVFCACLWLARFQTKLYSAHALLAVKLLEAEHGRNFSKAALRVIPSRARTAADFHEEILEAESKIIKSVPVLNPVIWDLNLNVIWGERFYSGTTLKTWETMPILTNRIAVSHVPEKPFLMISCWNESPVEAANIANGIARAYLNFSRTNPASPGVEICKDAEPNQVPYNINKRRDILSGASWGVGSGFAAGLGMAGIVLLLKRKPTGHLPAD